MNLSRGRLRYRSIQGLLEIPLLEPGELRFEVLLNGTHGASHVVTVHRQGAAKAHLDRGIGGRKLRPPILNSSADNWNMKSSGKRFRFRWTCSFSLLVGTWYNSAKSRSSKTFWPRIKRMAFSSLGGNQGIVCHLHTPQLQGDGIEHLLTCRWE